MHVQPNPSDHLPAGSSVADADDALQSAVLLHLVCEHPIQLTLEETILALADGSIPFADRVGVQDAVRALTKTGLLHQHGACVVPTVPALRSVHLLEHGG